MSKDSETPAYTPSLPRSVSDVFNFSIFVAGRGLVTKNFPFSQLREIEFEIDNQRVSITPLLAAYLIAAAKSLPTGHLLDHKTLLKLMTGES